MRTELAASLHAGLLFALLGTVAWVSGQPFVFPSLGPSAFVLGFESAEDRIGRGRIVASHALGGLAGFLAWTLFAPDAAITATPPAYSLDGLRLAASATASVVVTSGAMVATETVHPPACATTLIVSLGLLSTPGTVGVILASVVILVEFHAAVRAVARRIGADAERTVLHTDG